MNKQKPGLLSHVLRRLGAGCRVREIGTCRPRSGSSENPHPCLFLLSGFLPVGGEFALRFSLLFLLYLRIPSAPEFSTSILVLQFRIFLVIIRLLFPFRYPMKLDTAYFGGISNSMGT